MKEFTHIYTLSCPESRLVRYVGKSDNPHKRYQRHMEGVDGTKNSSWIISLKNKGLKPVMEIVDKVPYCDWELHEIRYINLFKAMGANLNNLQSGGSRPKDHKESIAKRIKTKSNKPYVLSDKQKDNVEKLVARMKKCGPWNKGKRYTVDLTDEQRLKKSIAQTGRHQSKPVLQYDLNGVFIKEWTGAYQAYKTLGISFKNISSNCKGRYKSAGGFIWKFKEE